RSVQEIRRAQQSHAPAIKQLKAMHVPSRMRSLLKSMLALEPAARPGTQELAVRLRHCSAQASALRPARVALATAVIAILGASAFLVFHSVRTQNLVSNPAATEKTIALLPFENLSRDPDNAYFAEGVQDEILTDMTRIADLKVIGRTSVMQYKSGKARNLQKIANQLRVAHLLEGSVQRSGNRVRVNAQLVNARTERRLWAHTYDGDFGDFFAIQSRIAMAIADQLHAKLAPNAKNEIERPATNDIIAFDLYTRAKGLVLTPSFYVSSKPNLLQAEDLLNKSVMRDRSFFRGYCQLAFTHDELYFFGHDHTPARLKLAEAAVAPASRGRPVAG